MGKSENNGAATTAPGVRTSVIYCGDRLDELKRLPHEQAKGGY
jgi:hypothetical protein